MIMTLVNLAIRMLIHLKMAVTRQLFWKPLIRKTHNPKAVQDRLLMAILNKNRDTDFGKQHHFSSIRCYEDYKKAVSVKSYEDLRPFIEAQEEDKVHALNVSPPIMYAQTSGTTGKPKLIPILAKTISQYRRSQHCVAYAEYKDIPGVYEGKILAIVSPAVEGFLETGTPFGSMSGLIYQSMPKFVSAKYVVPPEVFEITDSGLKYDLIMAFALSEQNITLVATANPSTLLKIAQIIRSGFDKLVVEVARGNTYGLKPNPARAKALRALAGRGEEVTFADLWPNLKSVTTWTGGNCAVLIPSVRKLLAPATNIVEMGYLSSEFRGSITVDVLNNKTVPTIHENFFEFVEREAWEEENLKFLENSKFITLDLLEQNRQYYVFVTTQSGLYRYFINDIIEVDGWFNSTPTIRFVQKGKGVTNLTGEKLSENQLIEAIQGLNKQLSLEIDFFMMLGCPHALQYSLFIEVEPIEIGPIEAGPCEGIVDVLESHLSRLNIEFKAKRQSGRLHKTRVVFVRQGTADAYKKHCIDQGQSEGQFKLVHLQEVKDCSFDFNHFRRG